VATALAPGVDPGVGVDGAGVGVWFPPRQPATKPLRSSATNVLEACPERIAKLDRLLVRCRGLITLLHQIPSQICYASAIGPDSTSHIGPVSSARDDQP
jgi:hypothetical protein